MVTSRLCSNRLNLQTHSLPFCFPRSVEHLFTELFENALKLRYPDDNMPERLWKNRLDSKYWCFSGEPVRYEEAYDYTTNHPYVRILLSPPLTTKNVS